LILGVYADAMISRIVEIKIGNEAIRPLETYFSHEFSEDTNASPLDKITLLIQLIIA